MALRLSGSADAWGIAANAAGEFARLGVLRVRARFSGVMALLSLPGVVRALHAEWPSFLAERLERLNILGHTRNQKSFLKVKVCYGVTVVCAAPTPFDDGLGLIVKRA